MTNKAEKQEVKPLTKTIKERITAFYEWAAHNEFTLDDMFAIICGVLVQSGVKGLSHEIKIAGRTFGIEILEKEEEKNAGENQI